MSRTVIYENITAHKLPAHKLGRRTLIPLAAVHALLADLPRAEPDAAG